MYQSLENLLKIEKKQRAITVNLGALAAAAGAGSKDASNKINEIVEDATDEDRFEEKQDRFKGAVGELSAPLVTAEKLANLEIGVNDNGRSRRKNP